jgi:hypothetical protein
MHGRTGRKGKSEGQQNGLYAKYIAGGGEERMYRRNDRINYTANIGMIKFSL